MNIKYVTNLWGRGSRQNLRLVTGYGGSQSICVEGKYVKWGIGEIRDGWVGEVGWEEMVWESMERAWRGSEVWKSRDSERKWGEVGEIIRNEGELGRASEGRERKGEYHLREQGERELVEEEFGEWGAKGEVRRGKVWVGEIWTTQLTS